VNALRSVRWFGIFVIGNPKNKWKVDLTFDVRVSLTKEVRQFEDATFPIIQL